MGRFLIVLLLSCQPVISLAGFNELGDLFPKFKKIFIKGQDVYFGHEYRLRGGEWRGWEQFSAANKDNLSRSSRQSTCSLNRNVKNKIKGDPRIIYCGDKGIWFGDSAYCLEGKNDNGTLFYFDTQTQNIVNYSQQLPRCEYVDIATRTGDEIWFVLKRDAVHGSYYGLGFRIYSIATKQWHSILPQILRKRVIGNFVYQESKDIVLIITERVIVKYNRKGNTWTHRYIKPVLLGNGKLTHELVQNNPGDKYLWMIYHLWAYPIQDRKAFEKDWMESDVNTRVSLIPILADSLVPHYIEALKNMYDNPRFDNLIRALDMYIENHPKELKQYDDVLLEIYKESLNKSTQNLNQLIHIMSKHKIPGSAKAKEKHFEALLDKAGSSWDDTGSLCQFISLNQEYEDKLTKKIREQKLTAGVTLDIVSRCIFPHLSTLENPAYRSLVSIYLRDGDVRELGDSCRNVGRNHKIPEEKDIILAMVSLINRLKKINIYYENGNKCEYQPSYTREECYASIMALFNSGENIEVLIEALDEEPNLLEAAYSVLSVKTGEKFRSVAEWQTWWRGQGEEYEPQQFNLHNFIVPNIFDRAICQPMGSESTGH